MDLNQLKSFNWRSLQKYFTAQATEDFNAFLEKLPANTSKTVLMMAGVAWAAAGVLGLFTTIQVKQLTELRSQLQEMEALSPAIPVLKDNPVDANSIDQFAQNAAKIYKNLEIQSGGSGITITGKNTGYFGQFREAIGHVQNGGDGWRVSVEKLCVGRECPRTPLSTELKINKVSVDKPG